MKPKVFVGSTSEAKKFAEALVSKLASTAQCRPWYQGIFEIGGATQASLVRAILECDYAVILLSAEDLTESRGKEYFSPRDNLIFEAGISFGALHPARTFLVPERKAGVKLPSDLNGFTIAAPFDRSEQPEDAIAEAAIQIQNRMDELGPKPNQNHHGSHEKLAEAANSLLSLAAHSIILFGRDLSWAPRYVEILKQKVAEGVSVEVFSDVESKKKARANAKLLTEVGAKVYYCEQDPKIKLTLVDHRSDAVSQFMISFKERNPAYVTDPARHHQFMYRYTLQDAKNSAALWLTVVRLYESLKVESSKAMRSRRAVIRKPRPRG